MDIQETWDGAHECAEILLGHPELKAAIADHNGYDSIYFLAQILEAGHHEHPEIINKEFVERCLAEFFWDAGYSTDIPAMTYVSAAVNAVTLAGRAKFTWNQDAKDGVEV